MNPRYFKFGEYDERIFVKDLKSLSFSIPKKSIKITLNSDEVIEQTFDYCDRRQEDETAFYKNLYQIYYKRFCQLEEETKLNPTQMVKDLTSNIPADSIAQTPFPKEMFSFGNDMVAFQGDIQGKMVIMDDVKKAHEAFSIPSVIDNAVSNILNF